MRFSPPAPVSVFPVSDDFNFWVPLEKASEDEHGDRIIEGIASTADVDLQGETVLQNGLDISYLKSRGFINWEHGKTPKDYIGEPIDAHMTSKGLWIRSKLYKNHKMADEAWDLAQALEKNESSRRLGYSIQGKVTKRNGTQIIKAEVHHAALTPQPVNPNSFARIAKSFMGEVNDIPESILEPASVQEASSPLVIHQLIKSESQSADGSVTREFHPIGLVMTADAEKALTAGYGTDSSCASGGRATIKEDLEHDKKKKKEKSEKDADGNELVDGGLKITTYKSLSKEEAAVRIRERLGQISDELCDRIISYATKF
jgi:hypothetical protein